VNRGTIALRLRKLVERVTYGERVFMPKKMQTICANPAVLVALVIFCLSACSVNKELIPLYPTSNNTQIANQQRLVSQAAREAVEQATAGMALELYKGKTARIEINGVFPHTRKQLLGYIVAAVEGAAAKAGVRILPPDFTALGSSVVIEDSHDIAVKQSYSETQRALMGQIPELRLVISVDWGGVDIKEQRYTTWGRLGGQLSLIIGSVALATAVTFATEGEGIMVAGPVGGAGLLGGILWLIIDPPRAHLFTQTARVGVTLRVIPVAEGIPYAQTTGSGENSVVIDPEVDTGYTLTVDLPDEKK
jgi:hypothetical protein